MFPLKIFEIKSNVVVIFFGLFAWSVPRPNNPQSVSRRSIQAVPKITGGVQSRPYELPYQLFLSIDSGFCGGTLVKFADIQFVLTAGHCVVVDPLRDNRTYEPKIIKILAGAWDISNPTGEELKRPADEVVLHPWFRGRVNDIALIFFEKPFPKKRNIIPLPLPQHDWPPPPWLTVSGWGDLSYNGRPPDILHKVKVYITDHESCEEEFGPLPFTVVCTDQGSEAQGTCQGDSGGPAVGVAQETARLYPFGIVSFGPRNCGYGISVHTYVPSYVLWIAEKVHQYKDGVISAERR